MVGGTYHVTARGNERAAIVRCDADRRAFVQHLAAVSGKYGWRILTYCLMTNHYHVLLQPTAPNLSEGMRQLNGVFAQWFNRRYRRVGHLFQGRFDARLVQADEHLLAAVRYIVRNPVAAGLCRDLSAWRWSSHRAVLGLEPPWFVDVGSTLSYFAADRLTARRLYQAFVDESVERAPGHPLVDGDAAFVADALERLQSVPGLPRRYLRPPPPPLTTLLAASDPEAGMIRAAEAGYSLREIARHLGVNASTVSRRLRRCRSRADATART